MDSSPDGNVGKAPLHEVREAACSLSEILLAAMSSERPARVVVKDAFRVENFGRSSPLLRFVPPSGSFSPEPEAVQDLAGPAEQAGRCHWCAASCPSWRSYVAHLREDHVVPGHVCDECAEVLTTTVEREAHKCEHTKQLMSKTLYQRMKWWCPLCPARFVEVSTMRAHRDIYHGGHGFTWWTTIAGRAKTPRVRLPRVVPRFGGPLQHTRVIWNQTNTMSSCSVSASDAPPSDTVGISDPFRNSSSDLPPMTVRLPRAFPAFEGPTEPPSTIKKPAASTNAASVEASPMSAKTSCNSTTTASSETDLSTVQNRLRHLMQLPPGNLYQLLQESSPLAGLHLPAPPPILVKATSKSAKTSHSAAASVGTTKQPTVRKRLRQLMKLRPANLHRLLRKSSPLAGLHLPPPPPIF